METPNFNAALILDKIEFFGAKDAKISLASKRSVEMGTITQVFRAVRLQVNSVLRSNRAPLASVRFSQTEIAQSS